MRKGFWHMIEVFIVVLIMFVLLMQFSNISRIGGDWSRNKLILQGRDIMNSLDASGVNWFNGTELDERLGFIFNGSNIIYKMKIRNTVKSKIHVACFCNNSDYNILTNALTGFSLNDREIDFITFQYEPESLVFSNLYDVTVVFDYPLNGSLGPMVQYMTGGRGVLIIRDLEATDFVAIREKAELETIFGLSWNNSMSPVVGNDLEFNPKLNPEMQTYPIFRYFYSFPNSTGYVYPRPHAFSNFLSLPPGEGIWPGDNDVSRMIVMELASGHPGLVVNRGVSEGNGKTAWLSGGSGSGDRGVLIKSVVVWLAGDTNYVIDNVVPYEVAVVSFMKLYNEDMYEAVEIIMSLGYLYETF
jgi:hypothetical protein